MAMQYRFRGIARVSRIAGLGSFHFNGSDWKQEKA
jgi:hypothetical protein